MSQSRRQCMAIEPSSRFQVMGGERLGRSFVAGRMFETMKATLAPLRKELPVPAQPAMGFFTDTSLCIGCKACEVACKQWNQLPANDANWTGTSYDNTGQLNATTWRHVQFIEQIGRERPSLPTPIPLLERQ